MIAASDIHQVFEDPFVWNSATGRWDPRPIHMGSDAIYLVLYGTGLRNGTAQSNPLLNIYADRSFVTGGLKPEYLGPQPEFAGLDQVNALLPSVLKNAGQVYVWLEWTEYANGDGPYTISVTLVFQE